MTELGIPERERKLVAGDVRLEQLGGEPLPTRTFVSTYHDTPDFRLARVGITLRRLVEYGKSDWQLRLPRGRDRLQLELPAGPRPPARIVGLLRAFLQDGRELVEIAVLKTTRSGARLAEAGGVAHVVLDDVEVVADGAGGGRFRELEIELVEGADDALAALERRVRAAGARAGDERPRLLRVLDVGAPVATARGDAPDEALRLAILRQYDQILRHDPRVRLGDDPEDVHRMRVAIRRLRAVLRAARPLLERAWSEPLRAELRWLAGSLGTVRDHDVLADYLSDEQAALGDDARGLDPLLELLREEAADARARLLEVLNGERYFSLLARLEDAALAPRVADGSPGLRTLARDEFRALRKAARRITPDSSDEELHRLRIKGKRARYTAELAAPALGASAERFIERAKAFQDLVGAHQDAVFAEQQLRRLVAERPVPLTAVATGRLIERQHARRHEARAGLPKAWSRLERSGRRAFS